MIFVFWFLILVIQEVFAQNVLLNGKRLGPLPDGEASLMSSNEVYILVFQQDGNLVIYTNPNVYGGRYVVWASSRFFDNPKNMLMINGDLQLCDTSDTIRWNSKTSASSNSYLKLDDDGRLRIYDGGDRKWTSTIGMLLILLYAIKKILDCFNFLLLPK